MSTRQAAHCARGASQSSETSCMRSFEAALVFYFQMQNRREEGQLQSPGYADTGQELDLHNFCPWDPGIPRCEHLSGPNDVSNATVG